MRPTAVLVMALAALTPACTSASPAEVGAGSAPPATRAPAPATPFPLGLDRATFTDSADIDNSWWPLKPGMRWTWEGSAIEGGERIERRVVFTVTDLTKDIGGVRALVGYDRDYNDGELAESELIFLAEADNGDIWHLGQYRETYDGHELGGGRAWIAGYLDGAKPGILMHAEPRAGTVAYSEGFAPPPFYWDDVAKVDKVGQRVCVRAVCYSGVVVIREYEPTKAGAAQLKYWARGVGNIKVGWTGRDAEREVLELVALDELSAADLAKIRAEALALEGRASLYGLTTPAAPAG